MKKNQESSTFYKQHMLYDAGQYLPFLLFFTVDPRNMLIKI